MFRSLAIMILLLLTGKCIFAGADSMRLLRLSMAEGMPSNNIYHILQDRNGYLWISTDNGLVKYNGYSFRVFNANQGFPNEMFGILEDSQRRIWVNYYGYDLVYIQDNTVKKIPHNFTRRSMRFLSFMQSGDKVYFGNDDSLHPFVEIDTNDKTTTYFLGDGSESIAEHPEPDKFLNIRNNKELYECYLTAGKIVMKKLCELPEEVSIKQFVLRRTIDSGFVAHIPQDNIIHAFNIYNCTYRKIELRQYGADESEGIYLAQVTLNGMYIVTNKRLYLLDGDLNLLATEKLDSIVPGTSQLSYYFADKADNKWYGTVTDGIFMRAGVPVLFKKDDNLSDLAGSMLVGTGPSGNSYWWHSKQKKLFVLTADLRLRLISYFHNEDIQSVTEESSSVLYLTFTQSAHNGVFRFNTGSKQLLHLADVRTHLAIKQYGKTDTVIEPDVTNKKQIWLRGFFNLHQYKPGTFYATTRNASIVKMNMLKDTVVVTSYLLDRYPNMLFDSIHKKYWLFNKEKLTLLDPETDRLLEMPVSLLKKLNIHNISQVRHDRFDNIYILSGKQIVIFNTKLFRLKYIAVNMDLANVFMEVFDNTLFVASKFGMAYAAINGPLSLGKLRIIHNIKGTYYSHIYGFTINAHNHIIFSTDKGMYHFETSSLKTVAAQQNTNNSNFMQLVVGYPQQRALSQGDTLYLSQQLHKIDFDLINLYGSGQRKYTYRIDGKSSWQTTEGGEVFVSDLKPGTFYKVSCYAEDEIWRSDTYTFLLYRYPYWYQTSSWRAIFWITGTLAFFILLFVIILVTRNIVARANEKRRLLTDLELRAIYAQINPHFIFNTLSSALYFISKSKMDEAYLHINKFSKLLRAYLKSSRDRYITLADEISMIRNYIELQQIRFENKFEYIIDVENKIAVDSIQIPSLLLQPLVENAIAHGLFHLPDGRKGLLIIKFSQGTSSNELICTIEDNGVGRKKAREIKKSSDAQYESYGTRLTEELINIFKQYENMNIQLSYTDKPAPGSGTIVMLTIRNLKYVA